MYVAPLSIDHTMTHGLISSLESCVCMQNPRDREKMVVGLEEQFSKTDNVDKGVQLTEALILLVITKLLIYRIPSVLHDVSSGCLVFLVLVLLGSSIHA